MRDLRGPTVFKLNCEVVLRHQSWCLAVETDNNSISSLFLSPAYWCHPRTSHNFVGRTVAISFFRRLITLDWKRSGSATGGLPHSCSQFLHCSFALLCFLLRAPQDVPQLLQVVQRAHQLASHCLHLTLQHLGVMQRTPPVASAGAHFFLQVLHCNNWSNTHIRTPHITNMRLQCSFLPMFSW